jgi:hypothetical protein
MREPYLAQQGNHMPPKKSRHSEQKKRAENHPPAPNCFYIFYRMPVGWVA